MIYNKVRRKTKRINIGKIAIGDSSPIAIQSMTNTDTHDKRATLCQILSLQREGCDIVRITVPDIEAVMIRYDAQYIDSDIGIADDIIGKYHIADDPVALIAQTDGTAGGGDFTITYMDTLAVVIFSDQIDVTFERHGIISAIKVAIRYPNIA